MIEIRAPPCRRRRLPARQFFGTNDLTQMALGLSRMTAEVPRALSAAGHEADLFTARHLVEIAWRGRRAPGRPASAASTGGDPATIG
jgi:phosphoenolpyruvate-protein kinase (PTS system EI component)